MYTHFTEVLACAIFGSALHCTSAWAVNKCTGPDGAVVFQDAPCAGKGETLTVKPASGAAPTPRPADAAAASTDGSSASKPLTEAQLIERQVAERQQDRRKQELEVRLLPEGDFLHYGLTALFRCCLSG